MSNKKMKKKHAQLKKVAAKKKKGKVVKKTVAKRVASKKSALTKKTAPKKVAAKSKASLKKAASAKATRAPKKRFSREGQFLDTETLELQERRSGSAGQSGDLQELSGVESADSESVDELLEEGNAFEAEAVAGVEHAADADQREVHTHEVPEDDVRGEYLDKD